MLFFEEQWRAMKVSGLKFKSAKWEVFGYGTKIVIMVYETSSKTCRHERNSSETVWGIKLHQWAPLDVLGRFDPSSLSEHRFTK